MVSALASEAKTSSTRVMSVLVGTSGFAYKEWKGAFYPEKLPNQEMLGFYASRFATVEINNTFYRMPSAEVLARWREDVPEGFLFVLKASRRITHNKRLKDSGDSLRYLVETSAALGDKLGPFLFQLPPNMKADLQRLTDFLALIPRDCRAAFEFRHPSWYADPVFDALARHDVALCVADTGGDRDAPFVSTASWGYLRLRRTEYAETELEEWADRMRSQEWQRAFVFFKHEDEATGPALAARFEDILA